MKVLSYLELMTIDSDELFHKIVSLIGDTYNMHIDNFYSQPFTPELIERYFEGFQFVGLDCWDIVEYRFQFKKKRYMIYIGSETTITNAFPHTLDDFINDCQRAGIELVWRSNG